ncbi:MAG: hypothetical protein WAO16_19075 [Pseudolabrys sp.]
MTGEDRFHARIVAQEILRRVLDLDLVELARLDQLIIDLEVRVPPRGDVLAVTELGGKRGVRRFDHLVGIDAAGIEIAAGTVFRDRSNLRPTRFANTDSE